MALIVVANRERAKGLAGEREVAALWESHGFTVRGLEGAGDHLCIVQPPAVPASMVEQAKAAGLRGSLTIHSEVKRQERARLWEWLEQLEAEAPPGTLPVLSFRRNRSPWYACTRLDLLAELLS